MSYVRWSTPIALPEGVTATEFYLDHDKFGHLPTSDFYIYDHVGGFVSVNIAGNRIEAGPEGKQRTPIDHPSAGETFEFEDMAEAIAKVEELIADGFLAPDWLIESMREELEP